jgi:hypothetical protein
MDPTDRRTELPVTRDPGLQSSDLPQPLGALPIGALSPRPLCADLGLELRAPTSVRTLVRR